MAGPGALEPFWVLHARPYRNTSLLLELFLPRLGRLGAVARGGRRSGLLQPFRPLLGQLSGAQDLRSLLHHEPDGPTLVLQGRALFCGLYVNELMVRLLQRDLPLPELAAPYRTTLQALEQGQVPQDVLLRHFEMTLLHQLGYGFSLTTDAMGQPVSAHGEYLFLPDQGLVPQSQGWPGRHLLAMAAGQWDQDGTRRVARDLLRAALAPLLGERPLVSRDLFR